MGSCSSKDFRPVISPGKVAQEPENKNKIENNDSNSKSSKNSKNSKNSHSVR